MIRLTNRIHNNYPIHPLGYITHNQHITHKTKKKYKFSFLNSKKVSIFAPAKEKWQSGRMRQS